MPTKQEEKQQAVREKQETQQLIATIGRRVIDLLGQPGDLHQVQVRRLWGDHYRVNVFVGEDAASARVAHSFFLVADSNGTILQSNPAIAKRY